MKRVFLIVLDSVGIGALPDAKDFGDEGANTLKSASQSRFFNINNMLSLGISKIEGLSYLGDSPSLSTSVGRCSEKSLGKDTTVGHWEIAGLISPAALPTFPDGFPKELIAQFEEKTGRKVICNKPYSGTAVLEDYGKEQLETGALIVYTSADSVFQIAAHESIISPEELYGYCKVARDILKGKWGVGRVIARPFATDGDGKFYRTSNRHDFSLEPTGKTLLDAITESGKEVIGVGKISDIFAHRGVTSKIYTKSNTEGIRLTKELLSKDFGGLCFVNLVDFDMVYGHRNDIDGYAKALSEFDEALPDIISGLSDDDMLIVTADHGCDPGDVSTDHTREYTPLIVYGKSLCAVNLGTRQSFADIAATVAEYLDVPFLCGGNSFLGEMTK